ncbi:unnamed protein product [Clonostachys rosea]|uniref:DUF7924 domain-containing protein n=1 Tax=Bionectria ochroleuca TaxID=29856 RepID=A0ABY6UPZ1_BIOOC|nr:unnamed protein product [Clonostachys rosea]
MIAHRETTQLEATSHNRKRQHADEPSTHNKSPSTGRKRQRNDKSSLQDSCPESEPSWQYPPIFWDRLSKIPLIHGAVEEFERRTYSRPSFASPPTLPSQSLTSTASGELARFSRHGGPDLQHLRGYRPATSRCPSVGAMSSSSQHRPTNAINSKTLPTLDTTPTQKSTNPYHRAFEQHLTDHQVRRLEYASQTLELEDVRTALVRRRASLSPSRFSATSFGKFQETDGRAKGESEVLATVIPSILGSQQSNHFSAMNTAFGNLKPLTDGTIVAAKPDIYDGAYPEDLDRSIRDEIAGYIIPSTAEDNPMAPNFFMEVKGPKGTVEVAQRQARYDGAIGSRAMHSLQNYNKEESYGRKPSVFSSVYQGGTLQLFAHHMTAPTTPEGRPEYHMIQLDTWGMTGNIDTFRRGATAVRNVRDLAKRYRDRFIQEANARGSQASKTAAQADAMGPHEDEFSAPHNSVDPGQCSPSQDADDNGSRKHIDGDDGERTSTVPNRLQTENGSQGTSRNPVASGDDPSMSITSISMPTPSAGPRRFKPLR